MALFTSILGYISSIFIDFEVEKETFICKVHWKRCENPRDFTSWYKLLLEIATRSNNTAIHVICSPSSREGSCFRHSPDPATCAARRQAPVQALNLWLVLRIQIWTLADGKPFGTFRFLIKFIGSGISFLSDHWSVRWMEILPELVALPSFLISPFYSSHVRMPIGGKEEVIVYNNPLLNSWTSWNRSDDE